MTTFVVIIYDAFLQTFGVMGKTTVEITLMKKKAVSNLLSVTLHQGSVTEQRGTNISKSKSLIFYKYVFNVLISDC